tara:strand:+ start:807 stop:998 length:192 start_codon:yes stop_codon:yes gene_type:complete
MPAIIINESVHPHPSWLGFLHHLVHEEGFTSAQLLHVIEKPWKWQGELEQYDTTGSIDWEKSL